MTSHRALAMVGWATVGLAGASLLFALATGVLGHLYHFFAYQTMAFSIVLGLVAVAAARRGRVNSGVWVSGVAALLMSWEVTGVTLAIWTIRDMPEVIAALGRSELAPADLPRTTALLMMSERTWVLSLGGFLTLGLLLFPDGRWLGKRWRIVAGLAAVGIGLYTVGNIVIGLPSSEIPWNSVPTGTTVGVLMDIGFPLVGISVLLSLASLIVRHHSSGSERRHQLRWMLFGAGAFILGIIGTFGVGALTFGLYSETTATMANVATLVVMPLLIASYGIGIVKYRLYDIDVVISRSIVFGLLATFITGVYVAIVVGLGSLIGDPSNLVLAVAATAFIAVVFEPVRQRVQSWANRLVYGSRATPYEVLSSLSVSQGVEDLVAGSAEVIAAGVGATEVGIWAESELVSVFPAGAPAATRSWDLEVPLLHQGARAGAVAIRKGAGDHVTTHDRKLVEEFAGQVSLLVGNLLLNRRLARRLDDLRESRRRLVATQDEARRKLERNLHDGAQQELVALKVKLGLARAVARSEGAEEVAERLEGVAAEADVAVDALRDLARGIYPPLLESEGLEAAVVAQVRKGRVPVTVEAAGLGRYGREVEATVYFCVLEALDIAVKHSDAEAIMIDIEDDGSDVVFQVSDDGRGFGADSVVEGAGLAGMRDRIDALDGSLHVDVAPSRGSVIRGRVPRGG